LCLPLAFSAALARPLVIVGEEYPPATLNKNGLAGGIDVDVARAVFDRLGVAYEIKLMPWARAWAMLKAGEADVGLHVSQTEDRAPYVYWPRNWVWQADFVFMTNRGTKAAYDIKNYADARTSGLVVGIVNQNAYHPSFWEAFPSPHRIDQQYDKQLNPAVDVATNMRKLAANRIQLYPLPLTMGKYMIRENPALEGLTHYPWILFSKPYPNAFSRQSGYSDAKYANIQILMQAYDAELGRLKSHPDEYQKFLSRYE
jgi:polar amino acid transport system substrate-binding protein